MPFDPKHKSKTLTGTPDKTANRAMMRAMGLGDKELAQRRISLERSHPLQPEFGRTSD